MPRIPDGCDLVVEIWQRFDLQIPYCCTAVHKCDTLLIQSDVPLILWSRRLFSKEMGSIKLKNNTLFCNTSPAAYLKLHNTNTTTSLEARIIIGQWYRKLTEMRTRQYNSKKRKFDMLGDFYRWQCDACVIYSGVIRQTCRQPLRPSCDSECELQAGRMSKYRWLTPADECLWLLLWRFSR